MHRSLRKGKENEKSDDKFIKPKIKAIREIKTYQRERTAMERIYSLFPITSKRRMAFRMILDLSEQELVNNQYMIAEGLLNMLITDRTIEKQFYLALGRVLRARELSSIKRLCIDYLKAQMSCDSNYFVFLEFLLRNFREIVVENKGEVVKFIEDSEMRKRIEAMKAQDKVECVDCHGLFYFTR